MRKERYMRDLQDSPPLQHIITSDGSSTLFSPVFNQHYHSIHGAIQESMHVFIQSGMEALPPEMEEIRIFEMGFGTGLNPLLSYIHRKNRVIRYTGIEAYPISYEQAKGLNYASKLDLPEMEPLFEQLHISPWGRPIEIAEGFIIDKQQLSLSEFSLKEKVDLIYFDAFAPTSQPDLWTEEVMEKMANFLDVGGIFVTYSAKSSVRRGLERTGLEVKKIPGPPGKREMLRARKVGEIREQEEGSEK